MWSNGKRHNEECGQMVKDNEECGQMVKDTMKNVVKW